MKKTTFDNKLGSCLKEFWTNYAGWGRATRSEYWWSMLFYFLLIPFFLCLSVIGLPLYPLYILAIIVPGFCLQARRLHDMNMSNWFILISLIPFVGSIVL